MGHYLVTDENGHSGWTRLLESKMEIESDRATKAANVRSSWTKEMQLADEEGGETRTTVFGGATQAYRKPLSFPADTQSLTIWVAADYHVDIGRFNRWLAKNVTRSRSDLDFWYGLKNHRVRRTFSPGPGRPVAAAEPEVR
jgi:hypothetical protein